MNVTSEWAGQSSEDHRATVLLRYEHARLLELFRQQHDAGAEPAPGHDGVEEEIASLVALMGRMERDILFPALPPKYAALVRAFEAEHEVLSHAVAALHHDGRSAPMPAGRERLEQLARDHLVQEEMLLYTELERDHPELNRQLYNVLVIARADLARGRAAHPRG